MAAPERVLVPLVEDLAHAAARPAEQLDQQCLLDVQPVLRLLPDQATRSVHHGRGDLLAAMGGQAVHREGVGPGRVEQGVVDPVARERVAALLGLGLLAHRRPGVGVDDRRAADGLDRVMPERSRPPVAAAISWARATIRSFGA